MKEKSSIFTFLVFLLISTVLWLMVKLSESYTTQVVFRLRIVDVPADKWLAADEQTAKLSMTADGFTTLRYRLIRESQRVVSLSLAEVPYRLESGTTYSFSSLYVTERIAEFLDITASDLTMNDSKVYFNMDPLMSKVVPVVLESDIRAQRQYGVYGIPILDPSSVTVYGPAEVIDTLRAVRTEKLSKQNVSESFTERLSLDLLDGRLRSNTMVVSAKVAVEKYTETDVMVPIMSPDAHQVRFFPEAMTVKCLVALKDYPSINTDDFSVEVDTAQLHSLKPLLDVRLKSWPQYVQVLNTHPDKVEYLIVQ
jgi:hypothetical protein